MQLFSLEFQGKSLGLAGVHRDKLQRKFYIINVIIPGHTSVSCCGPLQFQNFNNSFSIDALLISIFVNWHIK